MVASLGLGTAQFGRDYGISNTRGRVGEEEVRQILSLAADCKIKHIDAAHYDGDIERILGRCWPFPSPFKPQVRTLRLEKGLDWLNRACAVLSIIWAWFVCIRRLSIPPRT